MQKQETTKEWLCYKTHKNNVCVHCIYIIIACLVLSSEGDSADETVLSEYRHTCPRVLTLRCVCWVSGCNWLEH